MSSARRLLVVVAAGSWLAASCFGCDVSRCKTYYDGLGSEADVKCVIKMGALSKTAVLHLLEYNEAMTCSMGSGYYTSESPHRPRGSPPLSDLSAEMWKGANGYVFEMNWKDIIWQFGASSMAAQPRVHPLIVYSDGADGTRVYCNTYARMTHECSEDIGVPWKGHHVACEFHLSGPFNGVGERVSDCGILEFEATMEADFPPPEASTVTVCSGS